MSAPIRIVIFVVGLAAAFAGSFAIGGMVGNPFDANEEAAGQEVEDRTADDTDPGDGPTGEQAVGQDSGPAGLRVSSAGYTLAPVSAPGSTGESGTLSFAVNGPDGEPVQEYTESHEKDLHLIVVRTDTADYRHVHPSVDDDGVWSIDWEWDLAGTYKVFADFVPTALGEELTLARTIEVAGDHDPAPRPAESTVAEVDGYSVTLNGELEVGGSAPVTATIERDGLPVTELEPYLGAYGHLVALRDGDLAYIHVHPDGEPGDPGVEPGPDVLFYVDAPTPGDYRLFLDFQVDGQVHTADFTMTATGSGDPEPDARSEGGTGDDAGDGGEDGAGDDGHGDDH